MQNVKQRPKEALTKVSRCANKWPPKWFLTNDLCKSKVAQFYLITQQTLVQVMTYTCTCS